MTAQDAAEASRARDGKGVSAAYWRDVERGHGGRRGQRVPTRASARALAAMARVVGVVPAQLAEAGRGDAARVLEEILRREGQPPAARSLAVVPPPPLTLELGAEHILAEMSPEMRAKTEAHLPGLQVTFRTATIIGPSAPGSVIFPGNEHEATRWDRLVQAGYIEKPGEGYTPEEMVTMIAQGRALDDDARAAEGNRPRSRQALTSVT
jgi:hypothetical protein